MAASLPILEELNDFFTCSVCLEHFNNEAKQPKFLSCHHTLCLDCIKAMTVLLTVICPLCRKHTQLNENNTFELPNNYYIIQLMDNKTSSVSRSQIPATNVIWCLKCRKESSNLCSLLSGHSVISLGSSSLKFGLDLQESMDKNENQLKERIGKRIEAKSNYTLAFFALKVVEDAVKKFEEENNLRLVEIVSLLESFEKNLVIGEGENAQSLAIKVQECTQTINNELSDFQQLEEPLSSTIRDITNPASSINPEGGLEEHKITLPIAYHILLGLLTPVSDKLNTTSIPADDQRTPPEPLTIPVSRPVPKPKPTGFQNLLASNLPQLRLNSLVTGLQSSSNNNSVQQTAVPSSMINQTTLNKSISNSDLRRQAIYGPLLPPISQNEIVNQLKSLRRPPPAPPRRTSSSQMAASPSTGNTQPPGTSSRTTL